VCSFALVLALFTRLFHPFFLALFPFHFPMCCSPELLSELQTVFKDSVPSVAASKRVEPEPGMLLSRGDDEEESLPLVLPGAAAAAVEDNWIVRVGVSKCLKELAEEGALSAKDTALLIRFVLWSGLPDPAQPVRVAMLGAGTALINSEEGAHTFALLPLLEEVLETTPTSENSWQREGGVVLLGSLAKHLPAEDSRVEGVVDRLLDATHTPNEAVMKAVADCLPPLIKV
jgi:hypothetical protein